jgi:hypothetical protein
VVFVQELPYGGGRPPHLLAQIGAIETGDGLIHALIYEKATNGSSPILRAPRRPCGTLTGIKEGKGFPDLLTDPNPEVVAQFTKLLASAHKLLQDIEKDRCPARADL